MLSTVPKRPGRLPGTKIAQIYADFRHHEGGENNATNLN